MSDDADEDQRTARDRVLDAAEALLRDGGPDALSMRALADRAQVGHVTPYRLFESKHGVVLELLLRAIAPHVHLITDVDPAADPLEDLIARQHRLIDLLRQDEAYARAMLLALDEATPPAERSRWLDFVSIRSDEDLRRLVAVGVLRSDAPLVLTNRALLVGRDGAVRRWFRGLSTLDQLRTDYLSITLQVLLAIATEQGRPALWEELRSLEA